MTKMKKINILERMLHCVKIDKFKKMTLYIVDLIESFLDSINGNRTAFNIVNCSDDFYEIIFMSAESVMRFLPFNV